MAQARSGQQTATVLVIDPDPLVQRSMREKLTRLGRDISPWGYEIGSFDSSQRHRATDSAGAENRVGAGQLQRCHRESVAVGDRGLLDLSPVRRVVQQSRRLAGETAAGHFAEAERTQHRVHRLRRQRHRQGTHGVPSTGVLLAREQLQLRAASARRRRAGRL